MPRERDPVTHVVLLPGLHGTPALFGPLRRAIGERFEVVTVAYPDDGRLDVDALEGVVSEARPGGVRYAVVAESFSGPVGIAHAARTPQGLAALVLCASFASSPAPAWSPSLESLLPLLTRLPLPRAFVRRYLTGRDADTELVDHVHEIVSRVPAAVVAGRLQLVLSGSVEDRLAHLAVPVLYLAAIDDRLVGRSSRDRLSSQLPAMETVEIRSPHLILQCRADAAFTAIESFLKRTGMA